ncbi:cyclic nucleotide-binding domain-containing protein [Streptomyces antnestii]|uniref:Cyclic nucleotide-binding domain-containing protein n=1 Tax=Streptomyces antnestii TaxID=2494256 RepID=A0A437NWS1_9ACTN|nr:cyclic nucleotide-binding domain-containing protein [Streptomyces sp. San01]RVU14418.1 cyclic nucleotide-binding domain-containing protein [Streptomyces sp. San01]
MNAFPTTDTVRALPAEHLERLMSVAREVSFPQGTRLFKEGGRADRFWIIRSGNVSLDLHVPGRRAVVLETLTHNQLLGWSWLFAHHVWHLGAEATTPVRAYEFDAATVRTMCQKDAALGAPVALWVGSVVAHRFQTMRNRLLDLFGPCGSGHSL